MEFYNEAVIFVTGATGFVGKTLLEKLLWSFPQLSCIYILIREKNGKSVEQRFIEFCEHKIFERLRANYPQRLRKLKFLAGNIEHECMGLSSVDLKILCAEVNIIFHSAATVRFNERLKVAARVNAIATWNLLELCKEMPHLKSFVYVSTAYCNPGRKYVDEKIYPTLPPVKWKHFVDCTLKIPDEYFNSLANYIKGPHPNTYTFTKSIAEQIVNEYKCRLPIVIVRPSIVTASYREPYPGWIDNIQGITGIMMEIGKGSISSILGDKHVICDIIPVDFVVNSMIMTAQRATVGKVFISNSTSGVTNPITWQRLGCLTLKWSRIYPTKRVMMYPYFQYRKSFLLHDLAVYLLHYIPAILMDVVTLLRGSKRRMALPIAKKFRQACLAGKCFSLNEWIFMNNSRHYYEELLDAGAYPCLDWSLKSMDYEYYIRHFVIGIQKYLQDERSGGGMKNIYKMTRTARCKPPAKIREFRVPKHKINFDADVYTNILKWDNMQISEPPCLHFYTDKILEHYQFSDHEIIEIPEFPCHSQNTERFVRVVSESAYKVTDEKRMGYIFAKLKCREHYIKLESRQNFI